MKTITYGACELNVTLNEKEPAIFIDPGTPENIEIVSGTKHGIELSEVECRFLEKHHQPELIKLYEDKINEELNSSTE